MGIQINGSTDRITAIDGTIDFVSNIGNIGLITASNYVLQDAITIGAGSTVIKTVNGTLGIGTANPTRALTIAKQDNELSGTGNNFGIYIYPKSNGYCYLDALNGSSNNTSWAMRTYNNGVYNTVIQSISGNETTFSTGNTERFRIDSDGRVLIGLTASTNDNTLTLQGSSSGSYNSRLELRRGGNPSDGQGLGTIYFANNAGKWGAGIYAAAAENWTSGSAHGTDLIFQTVDNTTTTLDERARILDNGNFGIGTNAPAYKLDVNGTGRFADDLTINTTKKIQTNSSTGQLTIQPGPSYPGGSIKFAGGQSGATDRGTLIFYAGETTSLQERLRITSTGAIQNYYNSNLPVTDSRPILQLGYGVIGDDNSGYNAVTCNAYPVSGDSSWHYIGSSSLGASRYHIGFGDHKWFTAAAGTRGNDITWSERLRITSAGRVGINNTNPGYILSMKNTGHVRTEIQSTDNNSAGIFLRVNNGGSDTGNATIRVDSSGNLQFYTGTSSGNEYLRITSTGAVNIGTAGGGYSIWNTLAADQTAKLQVRTTVGEPAGMAILQERGDSNGGNLIIGKSRGGNGVGAINSGDHLGSIKFAGADGTRQHNAAAIMCYNSGTVATGRVAGSLIFSTAPDSVAGFTERLRIHSDGRVMPSVASNRGGVGMVGAFMARPSATYSCNSGLLKVTLNTEEFDANGWFDTSNSRYTPLCRGWYQFNFFYQIRTNITGYSVEMFLYPYKNGSSTSGPVHGWNSNYGNYAFITYSTMIYMNGSSDYVEMWGNSSRSTEVSSSSRMSGFLVHPVA